MFKSESIHPFIGFEDESDGKKKLHNNQRDQTITDSCGSIITNTFEILKQEIELMQIFFKIFP